jgi:hypothetical protein
MKVLFNNLSVVKKEAKQLKKFLKAEQVISISLQEAQDTVAKAYGWDNYNALFLTHKSKAKPADATPVKLLTSIQRNELELQKGSSLRHLLTVNRVDPQTQQEALDYSPMTRERIGRNPLMIIHPGHAIPENMLDALSEGAALIGINNYLPNFINRHVRNNLFENGGLLFLRESTAAKLIHPLLMTLSLREKNFSRFKLVRGKDGLSIDDSHERMNKYHKLNSVFANGSVQEIKDSLSKALRQRPNGIPSDTVDSHILICCTLPSLVWLRDKKDFELHEDTFRHNLRLEGITDLYKNKDLPDHYKRQIKTYLKCLPNKINDLLSDVKNCTKSYEPHSTLLMGIENLLASASGVSGIEDGSLDGFMFSSYFDIGRSNISNDPRFSHRLINPQETIDKKSIVIVVLDDEFEGAEEYVSGILKLYRTAWAGMLGAHLEGIVKLPNGKYTIMVEHGDKDISVGMSGAIAQVCHSFGFTYYPVFKKYPSSDMTEGLQSISYAKTIVGCKADDFPDDIWPSDSDVFSLLENGEPIAVAYTGEGSKKVAYRVDLS